MQIRLTTLAKALPDTYVLAVFEQAALKRHPFLRTLGENDQRYVLQAVAAGPKLSDKTARFISLPSAPKKQALIFGLGSKQQWNLRKRALFLRKTLVVLKDAGARNAALWLEDFAANGTAPELAVRRAVEELIIADFQFTKYKERPAEDWPKVGRVDLVVGRATPQLAAALKEGEIIGHAVNHCRVLANTPGGDMTPAKLAQHAQRDAGRLPKLRVRVLNEKKIRQLNMGGVLGVAQGSAARPRFIIIEYKGGKAAEKPLVFCGKGVTFDTGGLNLKTSESIYEMHMDMSGGAAIIHALAAIAQLKIKANVIGLVPAVENMPSGSSYRPGDVLRSITGKTIEVLNTDAEGRVILADALGYAQRFKPKLVVDVATLTGAAIVALGQRVSALLTQDRKLEKLAREAGERAGDEVWPLPLWDEYFEEIQGTFGDVANAGKTRYGGAITAALFLRQFVGDYPWMHIDIAPTMTSIEGQYLAKGAAGAGVRFLVEVARTYAK